MVKEIKDTTMRVNNAEKAFMYAIRGLGKEQSIDVVKAVDERIDYVRQLIESVEDEILLDILQKRIEALEDVKKSFVEMVKVM